MAIVLIFLLLVPLIGALECYNVNYDYGRKNMFLYPITKSITNTVYDFGYEMLGPEAGMQTGFEAKGTMSVVITHGRGKPAAGKPLWFSSQTCSPPTCDFYPGYGIDYLVIQGGKWLNCNNDDDCDDEKGVYYEIDGKHVGCDQGAPVINTDLNVHLCNQPLQFTSPTFVKQTPTIQTQFGWDFFVPNFPSSTTTWCGGMMDYNSSSNSPERKQRAQVTGNLESMIVEKTKDPRTRSSTSGVAMRLYAPSAATGTSSRGTPTDGACIYLAFPYADTAEASTTLPNADGGIQSFTFANTQNSNDRNGDDKIVLSRKHAGNFLRICRQPKCEDFCDDLLTAGQCLNHAGCSWCDGACIPKLGASGNCLSCSTITECGTAGDCGQCATRQGCGWCASLNKCVPGDEHYPCGGDSTCPRSSYFYVYPSGANKCTAFPYFQDQFVQYPTPNPVHWNRSLTSLAPFAEVDTSSAAPTIIPPYSGTANGWSVNNGVLRQTNTWGRESTADNSSGSAQILTNMEATVGYDVYPQYMTSYSVSCNMTGAGHYIGLLVRYSNPGNMAELEKGKSYYSVEWGSRTHLVPESWCTEWGYKYWRKLRLKRVSGQTATVLATSPIGYATNEWNRLEVQVYEASQFSVHQGTIITVLVEDKVIFTYLDTDTGRPLAGAPGLQSIADYRAAFTNFVIRPIFRRLLINATVSNSMVGPIPGELSAFYFKNDFPYTYYFGVLAISAFDDTGPVNCGDINVYSNITNVPAPIPGQEKQNPTVLTLWTSIFPLKGLPGMFVTLKKNPTGAAKSYYVGMAGLPVIATQTDTNYTTRGGMFYGIYLTAAKGDYIFSLKHFGLPSNSSARVLLFDGEGADICTPDMVPGKAVYNYTSEGYGVKQNPAQRPNCTTNEICFKYSQSVPNSVMCFLVVLNTTRRTNPPWQNFELTFQTSISSDGISEPTLHVSLPFPTNGAGTIGLDGQNVGTVASVLIGTSFSSLCTVTEGTPPVTCPIPPGIGANLPIVFRDATGTIVVNKSWIVAYAPPSLSGSVVVSGLTAVPTTGNTEITFSGSNFGSIRDKVTVMIGPWSCSPTYVMDDYPGSTSTIRCIMPPGQGPPQGQQFPIVITVDNQNSGNTSTIQLTYKEPTISDQPKSVQIGDTLTVFGNNFGIVPSAPVHTTCQANTNRTSLLVQSGSNTKSSFCNATVSQHFFTCLIPLNEYEITQYSISICVGGQLSPTPIQINYDAPNITAATFTVPTAGGNIALKGSKFGQGEGNHSLKIVETTSFIGVSYVTPTQLNAAIPPLSNYDTVTLEYKFQGIMAAVKPTVTYAPPQLSQCTPSSIPTIGAYVICQGTNFGTTQIDVTPKTNPTITITQYHRSDTSFEMRVDTLPAGVIPPRLQLVLTRYSASTPFNISYAQPLISTVRPRVGSQGESITITGTNFGPSAEVRVGNQTWATVATTNNHTQIVTTIGNYAGQNLTVVVVVNGVSSPPSPEDFSFNPPRIDDYYTVSGKNFPVAGGVNLTIVGANFGLTPTVRVGANPCTNVVATTTTTITCLLPAGEGTGLDLVVTAGGQPTRDGTFSYNIPKIQSFTYQTGLTVPTTGGQVTVIGTDFGVPQDLTSYLLSVYRSCSLYDNAPTALPGISFSYHPDAGVWGMPNNTVPGSTGGYYYASNAAPNPFFQWNLAIPVPGHYTIRVNTFGQQTYEIDTKTGTLTVDITSSPSSFTIHELGTFDLNVTHAAVRVKGVGAVADAIQVCPVYPTGVIQVSRSSGNGDLSVANNRLLFTMPAGTGGLSYGTNQGFKLLYKLSAKDVGEANGTFESNVTYAAPTFTSIRGCPNDDGNGTKNCDTGSSSQKLTIIGSNFGTNVSNVAVWIKNFATKCPINTPVNNSHIICDLPAFPEGGSGVDVYVQVGGIRFRFSALSFAGPKLLPVTLQKCGMPPGVANLTLKSNEGGELICITGTALGTEPAIISVTYKTYPIITGAPTFNCTLPANISSYLPDTIACLTMEGFGINYKLSVKVGQQTTGASSDVFNYPPPSIVSETIRNLLDDPLGNQSYTPANKSSTYTVTFDVLNLPHSQHNWPHVKVFFGQDPAAPETWTGECRDVVIYSSQMGTYGTDPIRKAVECKVPGGYGAGYHFIVSIPAGNAQSAVGADTFNYPTNVFAVTNITGCPTSLGGLTGNCPTRGGVPLTLMGQNFECAFDGSCALTVQIGGVNCPDVVLQSAGVLTCMLPPGTGMNHRVQLIQDGDFAQLPPNPITLSYAQATVYRVAGCETNIGTATANCSPAGGDELIIYGDNFGASNAIVFVGSNLCSNLAHDLTQPHNILRCTAPPGFGTNRTLRVLVQSNTIFASNPAAQISYKSCRPGEYLANFGMSTASCTPCPVATFSANPDAFSCFNCSAGRYAGTGFTACLNCPAGSYSLQGAETCTNCSMGRYQPLSGQYSCLACGLGTYSTQSGATSCLCPSEQSDPKTGLCKPLCEAGTYADGQNCNACPYGTFSDNNGSTSCTACPPGRYSNVPLATGCSPCEAGFVAPDSGSRVCSACSPGYYTNGSAITCFPCPAGSISKVNASVCTPCAAGYYVGDIGQMECTGCSRGRYISVTGATACQACPAGNFSVGTTGTSSASTICGSCGPGTYSVAEASSCNPCAKGYYTNTSGNSRCTACEIGKYQDVDAATMCKDCDEGQYGSSPGQISCSTCLPGTYSNTTGLTFCFPCEPGFSRPKSELVPTCQPCAVGHYQPASFQESCLPCPPGKFTNVTGSLSCIACDVGKFQRSQGQDLCEDCPAGSYNPATGVSDCLKCPKGSNSSKIAATSCSLCPAGTRQGEEGRSVCASCNESPGRYNPLPGAADCSRCGPGSYPNSNSTDCELCKPGFYQPGSGQYISCLSCGTGLYQDFTGQSSCKNCPQGRFSNATAQSSCYRCLPGYYTRSPNGGATSCSPCLQGYFSNLIGSANCSVCPIGRYTKAQGLTICSACEAGLQGALPGTCIECEAGRYAPTEGLNQCTLCPLGFFSPLKGKNVACKPCDEGTFANVTGSTACTECHPGTAVVSIGQSSCLACTKGKFANVSGKAFCDSCLPGYYQSSEYGVSCPPCPPGTRGTDLESCQPCIPGRFSNVSGSINCIDCPAGRYQSLTNQTGCRECPAGQFAATGEAICHPCPANQVAPNSGSSACSACFEGTPSSDSKYCFCAAGSYFDNNGGKTTCRKCPTGASCPANSTWTGISGNPVVTQPGYWRSNPSSYAFYRCILYEHCLGGYNSTCAPHRGEVGPLCAVCNPGTTESTTGVCTPCSKTSSVNYVQIVFIIIAIILVLVFMYALLLWSDRALVQMVVSYDTLEIRKLRDLENFHKNWKKSTDGKSVTEGEEEPDLQIGYGEIEYRPIGKPNLTYKMKIILSFFQIATNLAFAVDIPWPKTFTSFISIFNFFNLDVIQWSSVSCVTLVDYYAKLIMFTLIPMGVVVCIIVFYLGPFYYLVRGNDLESVAARTRHRRKVWKLVLFTMFLVYPKVSSSILSMHVCRNIDGKRYLAIDMSIECNTAKWYAYLPYNILMILVYPIGIPLFFFCLLLKYKKDFFKPGIRLQLGFLYDGFSANAWWFELADMLHKLLLTSILAFFPAFLQMPFGMAFAIIYLVIILTQKPYYRKGDDRLHMFAQVELFLLMLAGYISFQGNGLDEKSDVLMSVFLIAVITGFVGVFLIQAFHIIKKQATKYLVKRKMNQSRDSVASISGDVSETGSGEYIETIDEAATSLPQKGRKRVKTTEETMKEFYRERRAAKKLQSKKKSFVSREFETLQDNTDGVLMKRNPAWSGGFGADSPFRPRLDDPSPSLLPSTSQLAPPSLNNSPMRSPQDPPPPPPYDPEPEPDPEGRPDERNGSQVTDHSSVSKGADSSSLSHPVVDEHPASSPHEDRALFGIE